MPNYIKVFRNTGISVAAEAEGKMHLWVKCSTICRPGIDVPNGFSITVSAYKHFIGFNAFDKTTRFFRINI